MQSTVSKIRVLVIDDSIVARRMVSHVFEQTRDIHVEATAANGRIGTAKLNLNPFDAVVLDVEMPGMDGLETLTEIRKTHPKIPVVMFSSLTSRGAETTLEALSLGANDYVTKPSSSSREEAEAHIHRELVPRIRALCAPPVADDASPVVRPVRRPAAEVSRTPAGADRAVSVIGIGASTGGPSVLAEIIPALPKDLSVPVLVVQHMPPIFTKHLAERLDRASAVQVVEARDGEPLRPGVVYIAPGDFHLVVQARGTREVVELHQGPRENSCRPAVDVLFRSLAEVYGSRVCAAVLTGMGKDGLDGCRTLVDRGGRVVVQDQASSVVWGMPGFVSRAGLAQAALSPTEIAATLLRATQRGLTHRNEERRV